MAEQFEVVVIVACAAGMFCAAQADQLGCRVLLLDNGKKPGHKILMSGGGRYSFTNQYIEPAASSAFFKTDVVFMLPGGVHSLG